MTVDDKTKSGQNSEVAYFFKFAKRLKMTNYKLNFTNVTSFSNTIS